MDSMLNFAEPGLLTCWYSRGNMTSAVPVALLKFKAQELQRRISGQITRLSNIAKRYE
jgi:hypothetical protein